MKADSCNDPRSGAVYAFALFCLTVCAVMHLLLSSAHAAALPSLITPPLGDRWFTISMKGKQVGFAHTVVAETDGGFRVTSEGSTKMRVLGFSRDAASRERYDINPDLTIRSFEVEQIIDKKPLNLSGTVIGRSIQMTVSTDGGKSEKTLTSKGPVYPPPLINLYPLMKGFAAGRTYTLQMLDIEAVKVKDVTITGVGVENRNGSESLHFQNDLYPFVDNDIWLDRSGNTVEESVRDGLIVTRGVDQPVSPESWRTILR